MPPGSKNGKVRPSEVAADTKRNFIPWVNADYAEMYPPYSVLFECPANLEIQRQISSTRPPTFALETGDPVSRAIRLAAMETQQSEAARGPKIRIPFICAANERRPGGDWETGCSGYEETLCRRSNLSATLSTPWSNTVSSNYPIPSEGGILSDSVVVYRGPHEGYERLDRWFDLPVVSVPPIRRPKLKDNGTMYSFSEERDIIRQKIRNALRICLAHGYRRIVIGDFGLGNGHRNPPREMAEMWRDVFLFDPDLRGQFYWVVFVFDDPGQSTSQIILNELAKKDKRHGSSKSTKHSGESSDSSSSSSSNSAPTDLAIFKHVFDPTEIQRVLSQPDPRYGLDMITT